MAVEIISGPSLRWEKSEFAQQEVARREQEGGELGLVVVAFSEIFRAIVPGEQSQLRDEDLAASGASRFAGATYDAAVGLVLAREIAQRIFDLTVAPPGCQVSLIFSEGRSYGT